MWVRDRVLHIPSKLEGFIVMLLNDTNKIVYGVDLELEEGNFLLYPIEEYHLKLLENHNE